MSAVLCSWCLQAIGDQMCGGCGRDHYCGSRCQASAWVHDHRQVCTTCTGGTGTAGGAGSGSGTGIMYMIGSGHGEAVSEQARQVRISAGSVQTGPLHESGGRIVTGEAAGQLVSAAAGSTASAPRVSVSEFASSLNMLRKAPGTSVLTTNASKVLEVCKTEDGVAKCKEHTERHYPMAAKAGVEGESQATVYSVVAVPDSIRIKDEDPTGSSIRAYGPTSSGPYGVALTLARANEAVLVKAIPFGKSWRDNTVGKISAEALAGSIVRDTVVFPGLSPCFAALYEAFACRDVWNMFGGNASAVVYLVQEDCGRESLMTFLGAPDMEWRPNYLPGTEEEPYPNDTDGRKYVRLRGIYMSVMAQIMHAMKTAYETVAFVHADLQTKNVMLKKLGDEYASKRWAFQWSRGRPDAKTEWLVIDPRQHQGYLGKIIDFGRSFANDLIASRLPLSEDTKAIIDARVGGGNYLLPRVVRHKPVFQKSGGDSFWLHEYRNLLRSTFSNAGMFTNVLLDEPLLGGHCAFFEEIDAIAGIPNFPPERAQELLQPSDDMSPGLVIMSRFPPPAYTHSAPDENICPACGGLSSSSAACSDPCGLILSTFSSAAAPPVASSVPSSSALGPLGLGSPTQQARQAQYAAVSQIASIVSLITSKPREESFMEYINS